jgi:cytochrome bd-type quinol oxidase subunit 2
MRGMKTAKISALAASFLAPLLLGFGMAVPVFAQSSIQSGLCTGANLQFTDNPTDSCTSTDATAKINNLIHSIVNLLSAIVGIVAVIMIIVGGLRYITSGGNDTSVTSAKNTILYAIIGLIIVALAQLLVRFTLNKITNS